MKRRSSLQLGLDVAAVWWQAPQVIAMRLVKLSRGGPAAAAEAEQMMAEKVEAVAVIGQAAMTAMVTSDTSKFARTSMGAVQRPLAANRKRLTAELRQLRN